MYKKITNTKKTHKQTRVHTRKHFLAGQDTAVSWSVAHFSYQNTYNTNRLASVSVIRSMSV